MSTSAFEARASTTRLNRLAVAAIIFSIIAATGVWVLGTAVVAVFAVGAGHTSLNQIKSTGERGRALALTALAIGYGIATFALINTLLFVPSAIQQLQG